MTFGIVPTGFEIKTQQDLLASLRARQEAAPEIGPSQDYSDASALGQLNGTMSAELAELWELGQAAYGALNPEDAEDALLGALASLTGTARRAARASTVTLLLSLDAGVTVPAGSLVQQLGRPDVTFTTDTEVVSVLAGAYPVEATCTVTGPTQATAGTLTVIGTPVSGWTAVVNGADAIPGRVEDTDTILRQRRSAQLALRGGSTVAAMRADLLDAVAHPELETIREVRVLTNRGLTVNADGLPGKSFEVVIDDDGGGAANDDVAQVIFDTEPGGILAVGNTEGEATDENGDAQPRSFSRAELLPVYIVFTLTTVDSYPADGDDQVVAAIVAKGQSLRVGESVITQQLKNAAFDVAGVIDVPTLFLGFAPAPVTETNLVLTARQRATFDTGNVSRA